MFGRQKTRIGVVVSDKMEKTVVVAIESFRRHRIYKKILRRTRRYKVHDEHGICDLGDRVRIVETRPLSHDKRWRVAEVLVKGELPEIAPKEIDAELIGQVRKEHERVEEAEPEVAAEVEAKAVKAEPEAEAPEEVAAEVEAEAVKAEPVAEAEAPEEVVAEVEAEAEVSEEKAPEAEEKPKRRSRRKEPEEPDKE
jgi:small subunit ribosomal protein S17